MSSVAGGRMEAIDVSPEMLTLVGTGGPGEYRWPSYPVAFEVTFGEGPSNFTFHQSPSVAQFGASKDARLLLIVERRHQKALRWAATSIRSSIATGRGTPTLPSSHRLTALRDTPIAEARSFCVR